MCILSAPWVICLLPVSAGDTGTEITGTPWGCKSKAYRVQQEKLSGFSPSLPHPHPKPCQDEENQEQEGPEQQRWCLDGCWGGALGTHWDPTVPVPPKQPEGPGGLWGAGGDGEPALPGGMQTDPRERSHREIPHRDPALALIIPHPI